MNDKIISLELPYYAVIFSSKKSNDTLGYEEMASYIAQQAAQMPGFLGMESVTSQSEGITVSYWKTIKDISYWKQQTDHKLAQRMGTQRWYDEYRVKICLVERQYNFNKI